MASLAMAFKDMHLPWLLHTGLPGHTAKGGGWVGGWVSERVSG